ncbi:DEAD/DEAH box helicase [bacterium]|nr:DEAD/DEAH box helicase [bacterium]
MQNKKMEKENLIYDSILDGYQPLIEDILDRREISGIDTDFYDITAELLGRLLGKSVWISTNKKKETKNSSKEYTLTVGETFNTEKLTKLGYNRVERVWEEGDYSILGDIVTIWPYSMTNIVRISIFGEQIETIDLIDVNSRKKIKSITNKTILDNTAEVLVGNEDNEDSVRLSIVSNIGEDTGVNIGIRNISGIDNYSSQKAVLEIIKNYKSRDYKIYYLTKNIEKYAEFTQKDFGKYIDKVFIKNTQTENLINKGFTSSISKVVVLTDLEVLGEVDLSIFQEKNLSIDPNSVALLKKIIPGDFVVHEDHGIGQYVGIHKKESGYYIEIAYAGKDRLFVPVSAASKLTKYIGAGKAKPILTGLNSGIWKRISKTAKDRAENIAKELLELYAKRETSKIDPMLQGESSLDELQDFINHFEFTDTDDQQLTTKQIVDDMQTYKPMDRLLVGDVGYGKTEMAMRAMFIAVNSGFQVAFLAPTTILVEQHYHALQERFKEYPFNIGHISRFLTKQEKQETLEKVEKGSIDIVVGTHALLGDKVKFKNLGLLVIDEEQKFGVTQKEKIKEKKLNCNVLSLTATPIPRTLNMALIGIRDISVLATPPDGRKEIINHFEKFNWESVEGAIKKELKRKGKVYFLHNRVGNIEYVYHKLEEIFPDAKIGIAHGQMNSKTLTKVMNEFVYGDMDILICTTIIENGLDIPTANTLIVDDSTMLGLSQMYQIRGRIGRSTTQAYAYFYYERLRGDSELRLEALKNSQELGSGFLLSNKDLEIRGAGDILGKNQSGAINSVGYGLYSQMLSEAVTRLKTI